MISNNNFRVGEVPTFHPVFERHERKTFWKTEKRKCIEGYWVGGKWMPGPLYYYVNYHNILFEDDSSVSQAIGLPWLRDIDWELFLIYEEARGFSGFTGDPLFTCDRKYGPESKLAIKLGRITEEEIKKKTYIPAREYLRRVHPGDLGKPLYKNNAKNLMSIQSRGGGKTYSASGMVAHNYLFDGATNYDFYLERKRLRKYLSSDTIVGAIDTKYSANLLSKVKVAFEHLPGNSEYLDIKYDAPLFSRYTGSLTPNKEATAIGSKSLIRHRTFKDNPLAANGTRPNLVVIDEVGFMNNIIEAWGSIESTQASKAKKNLVIMALGTGGLVSGEAALYAESIFRNPDEYNCLAFDDNFEQRGEIGYFVPAWRTLNEFKGTSNFITDESRAMLYLNDERARAKRSPSPKTYQAEIINRPFLPSEAFLVVEGAYFPTLLLKERLSDVEGNKERWLDSTWKGELRFNEESELEWRALEGASPIHEFPLDKNARDKVGCIELYEHPQVNDNGIVPFNQYILGVDTVDKAASTTDSLFSCFVLNRFTRRIVAEYTGRHEDPKQNYEMARKLAVFYNGTIMYEQNLPGLFTYFEQTKSLYMLADTPRQLRNSDTFREGTNTSKGIMAGTKVNDTARQFIKSFLYERLSDSNPDLIALRELRSPGLIKELIRWNPDGNFDRVSALGMVMWHDQTLSALTEERINEAAHKEFDPYFAKMGMYENQDKFQLESLYNNSKGMRRKISVFK